MAGGNKVREKNLKENNVWEILDIDKVRLQKPLSLHGKWIFKIKHDRKCKARLMVRGYEQKSGLNWKETSVHW